MEKIVIGIVSVVLIKVLSQQLKKRDFKALCGGMRMNRAGQPVNRHLTSTCIVLSCWAMLPLLVVMMMIVEDQVPETLLLKFLVLLMVVLMALPALVMIRYQDTLTEDFLIRRRLFYTKRYHLKDLAVEAKTTQPHATGLSLKMRYQGRGVSVRVYTPGGCDFALQLLKQANIPVPCQVEEKLMQIKNSYSQMKNSENL